MRVKAMEAYLYETLEENKVKCNLCSHRCVVKTGRRGICGVRENQSGTLKTLVYDKLIARHIDPIEKKPLFHFLPGTLSYSIAISVPDWFSLTPQIPLRPALITHRWLQRLHFTLFSSRGSYR